MPISEETKLDSEFTPRQHGSISRTRAETILTALIDGAQMEIINEDRENPISNDEINILERVLRKYLWNVNEEYLN